MIVVAAGGSCLETALWEDNAPALLLSWLGGEGVGEACGDTLTGLHNPCGRLAQTFPMWLQDVEAAAYYSTDGRIARHREQWAVGYRAMGTAPVPQYPFGYGLSYTTFGYTDLQITKEGDIISAGLNVTNTGLCDGAEVVQPYVEPLRCTLLLRPKCELRAFAKVFVKAGQTETVTLRFTADDCRYYQPMLRTWVNDAWEHGVLIGASCTDIRLRGGMTLEKALGYTGFTPKQRNTCRNT